MNVKQGARGKGAESIKNESGKRPVDVEYPTALITK